VGSVSHGKADSLMCVFVYVGVYVFVCVRVQD
jgi:hypothetical protein